MCSVRILSKDFEKRAPSLLWVFRFACGLDLHHYYKHQVLKAPRRSGLKICGKASVTKAIQNSCACWSICPWARSFILGGQVQCIDVTIEVPSMLSSRSLSSCLHLLLTSCLRAASICIFWLTIMIGLKMRQCHPMRIVGNIADSCHMLYDGQIADDGRE